MSCDTTQLLILSFCGPHAKPYGVRELSKHYCLLVEPKLFHGKFAIRRIPFACIACTTMLEKLRYYGVNPNKQPHYQSVVDCTYWPVLGSFTNWKIIQFTNKTTPIEDFDEVHKVVLYGISVNMTSLVQLGKSADINITDPNTMGCYVIK